MEVLLVLLIAGLAGALSHRRLRLRSRSVAALPDPGRLRTVAERLGLSNSFAGACGNLDGFAVEIEEDDGDRHRFVIDSRGRIPDWLRITVRRAPRPLRTRALDAGAAHGLTRTQDRFFDDRFAVHAPVVGAGALLDASVRRTFLELGRVRVENGRVSAVLTASRAPAIERAFRQLLEAAGRLAADTPYGQRLLDIATTDQNPFVRLRALELLAEHRPHDDETQRALWLALDDPHVPNALFAAIKLGARVARDHLKRLARLAASADEERITAFAELLEHEPSEEMLPLLLEASRSFYGKFAARALAWTAEHGGRDALLALLRKPGATQSENLIAILDATAELAQRTPGPLGARLDPEMEQAVLRILLDTRRRLMDARTHAARTLGALGSPNALPALREIARGELGASTVVARAAREAIERMQSRRNAMSGGLALVEPAGDGELSFSGGDAGALSSSAGDPHV